MFESKFKKQIGFIRNHSSKKNFKQYEKEQDNSSDSFSSFQYNPHQNKQQFSPYRHPIIEKYSQKGRAQPIFKGQKHKIENNPLVDNRKKQAPPNFSNQILRNNFLNEINPKKYQNEEVRRCIQKVNAKITKAQRQFKGKKEIIEYSSSSSQETPKLKQNIMESNHEDELSMSNINKFQRNDSSEITKPLKQQFEQRYPKKYKKYAEDSSDHENQEAKITFKKPKNKRFLQQQHIQTEQRLIQQWDKKEFKDKRIKTAIMQQPRKQIPIKQGLLKNTGGICFELDKRQFTSSNAQSHVQLVRKPKKNLNSKQEIIKRKLNAKRYDRQSRLKVFGA